MTSRRLRLLRVLVVDDSEASALRIEKQVWRAGGAAARTATIDAAARHLREHEADLVLVRQDLAGTQGAVGALSLPEMGSGLRIVFFGDRPDPRLLIAAEISGRALTLVRHETLADWIAVVLPLLARVARDERRVARLCRASALVRAGARRSTVLPVRLNDVVSALEEGLIRAAVEEVQRLPRPSIRKAAKLLGLRESSLRTKMKKLGVPWPRP